MEQCDYAWTSKAQLGTNVVNTQGPTLNKIVSKLTNAHKMTKIDASSGHHNLKRDRKFSFNNMHVT